MKIRIASATSYNARALTDDREERLVGSLLFTAAMGDYPGGLATVTHVRPDPNAPEIVMQVKHDSFGSIGIFGYEEVVLIHV